MSNKARFFWPLVALLVLTDCTSKELAVQHLSPPHIPHDVLGSMLRFTLAYNPGGVFGVDPGPWSRPVLIVSTIAILVVLAGVYRHAAPTQRLTALALALVSGGAIGNLLDRLRSPRGVVDFIDIGLGAHRFWTFNVADVGITVGAVLLAVALWRRKPEGGPAPR